MGVISVSFLDEVSKGITEKAAHQNLAYKSQVLMVGQLMSTKLK